MAREPEGGESPFGTYDVRDFMRWQMLAPQAGNVIVTTVPGEVFGREDVEGIFAVVNTTLAFDASMLVHVRAIGASREDALPALSSLFNRRPGALHICLNEGPCAVEDGVFHVRRLDLWSGSGFPGHRLSVAGRKLLKQLLAPGGATAEDEAHPEAGDAGEDVEDLRGGAVEGTEQAMRPGALRKERGKGGTLKSAAPKRKVKEKTSAAGAPSTAPGKLRERLEKVRQKQQDLGIGRRVHFDGEPKELEEAGDAGHALAALTTGAKIVGETRPAGDRRAGLNDSSKGQRGDILKNLRLRRRDGGVVATLATQAAQAARMKKKTPKRKKDKRIDALKILLDGKKRKKKKKKEKKRKREEDPDGGDSGGSSGSSEEEDSSASSAEAGNSSEEDLSLLPPLKKKSEREEGSVLELLISQIELRLNELGGAAEHENPVSQGTKVLTYWHTLTHSGGVNAQNRDGREMFLLANCMDLLRIGRLGRLGDALAARWLALEQAGLDQNWTAARHDL